MSCQIQSKIAQTQQSYSNSLRSLIFRAIAAQPQNRDLNEEQLQTKQQSEYESIKGKMGYIRRAFQTNQVFLDKVNVAAPIFHHIYKLAVE